MYVTACTCRPVLHGPLVEVVAVEYRLRSRRRSEERVIPEEGAGTRGLCILKELLGVVCHALAMHCAPSIPQNALFQVFLCSSLQSYPRQSRAPAAEESSSFCYPNVIIFMQKVEHCVTFIELAKAIIVRFQDLGPRRATPPPRLIPQG
jgi:hypothetical protein